MDGRPSALLTASRGVSNAGMDMGRGPSYAELRGMTDETLVRCYDAEAKTMGPPAANFYLDEIKRRTAERAADAAIEEAHAARNLAIVNAVFAGIAVVVAVAAPFLQCLPPH